MPNVTASLRQGPSLRIEELAITNFRTFRERTVISFRGGSAEADAIATFHGENGSGKSNAIAALSLFFEIAVGCLSEGEDELLAPWDISATFKDTVPSIHYRDRPTGESGPTDIEVRFADERLGCLRVRLIPSGGNVRIRLERLEASSNDSQNGDELTGSKLFTSITRGTRDSLITWLRTPFGPGSRPIAPVTARRRTPWMYGHPSAQGSLLHDGLAEELFNWRTSLRPELRESFRAFTRVLSRFRTLQGKEISIERTVKNQAPELILEEHGRSVLRLDELSSGEQQLFVLCASTLLANTGILVIEEPELSLDHTNQKHFQEILKEQVEAGLVDQVILESHVAAFDGPNVIRFRRGSSGVTEVTREPSTHEAQRELEARAQSQGAKQRWVTRDGYTQLPEAMREALKLEDGGHVWFLKNGNRWEAWREGDLTELLSGDETEDGDG